MRFRHTAIWLTACVGAWAVPRTTGAAQVDIEPEEEEIPDFVEVPEAPPPSSTRSDPSPPPPRWRSSLGGGVAHFAADGPGQAQDSLGNWGVSVYARTGVRIAPSTRLRLGTSAAFTEFDRTAGMWDIANEVGRWTTDAYGDVYDWTARGADDKTLLLRIALSVPVFGLLLTPYILAGAIYLAGPVASGTFMTLDATVSRRFGQDVGPYVESGLGLLAFSHPESPTLRAGMGPILGIGVDLGPWTLGARIQWSPPVLHDQDGIKGSHLWASTLTAGFTP